MKLKITLLLSLIGIVGMQSFAQSNLYVGYRGNGTINETELARLDTTGGVITFIGNTTLSSDYVGAVSGIFGMALHPFTNDVYVVYGVSVAANLRRLGKINLTSAAITDIGEVGAVTDITFVDTTLYASYGSDANNEFATINTVTGEATILFIHATPHSGSSAINFDYHKEHILRSIQGAPTYTVIDVNELTEASVVHAGHPGWTTNLLTLNNGSAYSLGNNYIHVLNTNTFDFSTEFTFPASNYVHASVFGNYPLSLWVNGNRNMCAGDESILTVVGVGSDFEWYKDGVLIAGATSSTYAVSEAGEYVVIVDGKTLNQVTITVAPIITPGFTLSANPAFLEGAADVTVDFAANASGIRYTYEWESGEGETASIINPTFTYDAIGDYVVTVLVTDTVSIQQCVIESADILTVAGGVGIGELENSLSIYPVPAEHELYIDFANSEAYTIQILDLSGAIVMEKQVNTSGKAVIQLSELTSGTYICKLIGTDYTIERMFVKQ